MAIRKFTRLLALLLVVGCASVEKVNPVSPAPVSAASTPVGCDLNGACSGTIKHTWGYCQYTSYQTQRTFVVAMEVGFNSTPTDANDSVCAIPFALGGGQIKSIHGNTNYTPWTNKVSSMFLNVRACTAQNCNWPDQQEHLIAHKYTVQNAPQSVTVNEVFIQPINATAIMAVFNDDLPVKPTTLSMAFSGEFK